MPINSPRDTYFEWVILSDCFQIAFACGLTSFSDTFLVISLFIDLIQRWLHSLIAQENEQANTKVKWCKSKNVAIASPCMVELVQLYFSADSINLVEYVQSRSPELSTVNLYQKLTCTEGSHEPHRAPYIRAFSIFFKSFPNFSSFRLVATMLNVISWRWFHIMSKFPNTLHALKDWFA